MSHFHLEVLPAAPEASHLLVWADPAGAPSCATLRAQPKPVSASKPLLFSADVTWGGGANPLLSALPPKVTLDLSEDTDTASVVHLLHRELSQNRCGASSVINRLAEILLVRLLRSQIEQGATEPGLLAGLADPRLSRCIVAIHDKPQKTWTNPDLASLAGLSLSRFAETFLQTVGVPPQTYLREWRLTLARQDLAKGDRVSNVARRYGYGSPEAFTRAFKQRYSESPIALRPKLKQAG